MKSLKLGVLTDQLVAGGVQLAAIEQIRHLNKLGHQAQLIVLMRKKYSTDFSSLAKDIPHMYLSDHYPKYFKNTVKFPIFNFLSTLHLLSPFLAPKVIKNSDFDIIISLGTTTSLTAQAIYRRCGIPYITVIHDPFTYILKKCYDKTLLRLTFPFLVPLLKNLEKSFIREAREVLIISQVHYQFLKENYHIKPKIFSFGINILLNLPNKRGDELLSFGRWDAVKNADFLLKLIADIPSVKLTIAGSWIRQNELEDFKKLIRDFKLEKRVKIIPYYDKLGLYKLCKQARAWIYASFETFSLAGLEAAAHGLPIIIPERSGITEYFKHGVDGYFPKALDLNEYKKYISYLLSNERLAYHMGLHAAKIAKDKFSWNTNTKRLLEIISSNITSPKKPRIIVIEAGHVKGDTIAGGDKLMEPMAQQLTDKYQFSVIVPKIGAPHWLKSHVNKQVILLPKNIFDQSINPVLVFLNYLLRVWQTIRILKDTEDEIIYSSTDVFPDIFPAFIIKKLYPKRVWIARMHHIIPLPSQREGNFLVNFMTYILQKFSVKMMKMNADLIIALNEQVKISLIKSGVVKNKIEVLGAGIDYQKITKQKVIHGTKIYDGVFLGRFHRTKGIYDLIPIWKNVISKYPEAKLAVIGASHKEISNELNRLAIKEGIQKNIDILGYLSSEKVYSIMKKAKIFLFTDHEAGFGIAVAEAMACGLPVIGWDIGILGNIFKKGNIKIPAFNHLHFAKTVVQLMENEQKRSFICKEVNQQVALLDWKIITNRFNKIINKLVI